VLTAAFAAGRDIHTATAGMIAGIPIDEVNTEQRQCAKAINFGTIYGIAPRALADNIFGDYGIVLTIAEARQALDRFKQTYPVLHSNQQVQSAISQRRNYIDIGAGRRVWGSDQPGGRLSHPQCSNLPVQGLGADCMLRALPLVDQRLAGLDAGLVGCVHDELLVEAAEKDAETGARILKDTMIEAFEATCPGAPTRNLVEVGIGRTWRDAKP
jgi:DNA polymerase-1